jgi:DNA-binding CsgD family transcriptional regulator
VSAATNTLNAVRQAAIAIDRYGFVLDVNAAMEAIFDDSIRVCSGRLLISDVYAKGCVENLLDRLRAAPDAAAFPCDPIVVRRKTAGPVVIRVLPVPCAARTPFFGARALLTFAPVEVKTGPKPELLEKVFGLTPAEARLASIVAEGVGPEQVAEELRISRETARNQLKAVFAKTATHRQSELVALISRM